MASNLVELLSENGIKKIRMAPGLTSHVRCPACDGGKTHEDSLSVTIDEDGGGATWKCHRGTCVSSPGGARIQQDRPQPKPARPVKQPPVHGPAEISNRPDWLYEWFATRCIRSGIVDQYGVYSRKHWFNEEIGEIDSIVFPLTISDKVVNRKYRPRHLKHPQSQEKDGAHALFGLDQCGADPEVLIWVEGEPDVMAIAEVGRRAVTFKDGAPDERAVNHGRRFEALATHEKTIAKVKRFILAGDADMPGAILREELARRVGRHRCWIVTWPDGCKDANETLIKAGPDAVLQALDEAAPYPIEGMHKLQRGMLQRFRHLPPPQTMGTGTMASDEVLKLPTEGRVIVVTGFPNHGKTNWVRFVMVHTAAKHNRRWCVFSPESQPWEQFLVECAEVYSHKQFYPAYGKAGMTDDEIAEAEAFLGDKVTMLVCDSEEQAPNLDWLFERFAASILRDGTTDVAIDPYNEVDQQRGIMTETDFIGRFIQRCRNFGVRYGVNVWIVAHPAKPPPMKPGEKRGAPGPYDIAGSAHWANKPDLGVTIHNPEGTIAEMHLWKSKQKRWGRKSTIAKMNFDPMTGTYTSWTETNSQNNQPVSEDLSRGNWR